MRNRHPNWTETKTWTKPDDSEVEVEVEFSWVDNGIGAYEFWGAKGHHSQWCAEVVKVMEGDKDVTAEVDEDTINGWCEKVEGPPEPDYDEPEYEAD